MYKLLLLYTIDLFLQSRRPPGRPKGGGELPRKKQQINIVVVLLTEAEVNVPLLLSEMSDPGFTNDIDLEGMCVQQNKFVQNKNNCACTAEQVCTKQTQFVREQTQAKHTHTHKTVRLIKTHTVVQKQTRVYTKTCPYNKVVFVHTCLQ